MGPAAKQYGILLMNMGGPSTLDEIGPYLRRVLADPMLVRLPGGDWWQGFFASFVSTRRAKKVRTRYEMIGGGSPLRAETETLASRLAGETGLPVAVAMRYSAPFTLEGIGRLLAQGVQAIVGLPLYPQYSTSTTASSLAELSRCLPEDVPLLSIDDHHLEPGYLGALAEAVTGALRERAGAHVLFTAHSIPESYTASGDPYVGQVQATVAAVAAKAGLDNGWSLAWQSATRMGRWHGPAVLEMVTRLRAQGVTRLVVQPVSFVSENLETLYDLDVVLRQEASGMADFVRLPTPGSAPPYVAGLATLVQNRLIQEEKSNA